LRAVYIEKDIPRALLVKALKSVWPGVAYSAFSHAHWVDIPDPELPGPRWVRVRNRQCGICGSDLSLLFAEADIDIAPLALPSTQRFYLGHEIVGHVVEVGSGVTRFKVGDRVIMDSRFTNPTCLSQEIDPPCPHCAVGNYTRCENASLGLGIQGAGGGWGDSFIAHETELYAVPTDLTDDQAMMVEVLILGGGVIGLSTLQCVRALAPDCHVTIVTRHPHQAEMAHQLGAHEVVRGEDGYQMTARITHARLYRGLFNNRMLLGGFDVIYDCVGSANSVQDCLRWARAGGCVVLLGVKMARFHVDLSPIWHQEVDLVGVLAHGTESWQGKRCHTYEVVIELMRHRKLQVDGLITHRFPLSEWKRAVATARDKRTGSIKVVITVDD
jgi:threonine dehydrogenase-like Zn-dependent dehydrogenase